MLGWTEIILVKPSTCTSGSKELYDALRRVFQTFGVPDEKSSDWGKEFISEEAVASTTNREYQIDCHRLIFDRAIVVLKLHSTIQNIL